MSITINESKIIGEGVDFQRTRRSIGYLVRTVDRFNNAKKEGVNDRVKHLIKKMVAIILKFGLLERGTKTFVAMI